MAGAINNAVLHYKDNLVYICLLPSYSSSHHYLYPTEEFEGKSHKAIRAIRMICYYE